MAPLGAAAQHHDALAHAKHFELPLTATLLERARRDAAALVGTQEC